MKAMVLAAGVGSRLRPLTDETPKALMEIGGMPMLELQLRRLKAAGVTEAVVNVHHHARRIEEFLRGRDLGLSVELSREEELLLDTGGGLRKAAGFFDDGRPFLVHNVDAFTDLDLGALLRAHEAAGALATLAVRERPASRYLLFDAAGRLCGHEAEGGARSVQAWSPPASRLGFDGVSVLSPDFLSLVQETGAFSLTTVYLRLAREGRDIRAFRSAGGYWVDIGTVEKLERARRLAAEKGLPA